MFKMKLQSTILIRCLLMLSVLTIILSACTLPKSSRPIDCVDDLQAIWDEFPQYGERDLEPSSTSHRPWRCHAQFTTNVSPQKVIEYYETQLLTNGWSIDRDYEQGNNIFAERGCLRYDVLDANLIKQEIWVTLSSARTIADVVKRGSVPSADAGPLAPFIEGDYKTLLALMRTAELDMLLEGKGPFTLFAPTQQAFAALSDTQRQQILGNPQTLEVLLKRHIVPYALDASSFVQLAAEGSLTVETLAGDNITLHFDGYSDSPARQESRKLFGVLPEIAFFFYVKIDDQHAKIRINDAQLSLNMVGPTQACNGFVYMIDSVLLANE